MGQITRDCPHCGTRNVAFISFGEILKPKDKVFTVSFYCAGCYGGVIAEFKYSGGETPQSYKGDLEGHGNLKVLKVYPVPKAPISPKFLPDNLDKFFLQAASSLTSGNYDASAMMSRKVLEVAVKALDPDGKGDLYKRIEKLAEKNIITYDLKSWAHIIRDDGNAAAHEEEPATKEFSVELLSFAEMFLMYTFTMPNMVKERRHDNVTT